MLIESTLPPADVLLRASLGFVGACIVSAAAVRMKALTPAGAVASTLVGTLAVAAGWSFAALLFAFFTSATAVSRYGARLKDKRLAGIVEKGRSRDAFQVFANGSVFAAACLWIILSPNPVAAFAAVGALSGACADTWATEIGSLSKKSPRSILSGKPVPTGTSGGITLLGALAALAGATVIALVAWVGGMPGQIFGACLVAGLFGAAVDSILGASVQSRRWCETCQEFTEREIHSCGTPTTPASGVAWMDNDAVNFFCTLVAAGIAALWVL